MGYDALDAHLDKWWCLSALTKSSDILSTLGVGNGQNALDEDQIGNPVHSESFPVLVTPRELHTKRRAVACVGLVSGRKVLLPSGRRYNIPSAASLCDYMVVRWDNADASGDSVERWRPDGAVAGGSIEKTSFDSMRESYIAKTFFSKVVLSAYKTALTTSSSTGEVALNYRVRRTLGDQWNKVVDQARLYPTSGSCSLVSVVGRDVLEKLCADVGDPSGHDEEEGIRRACAAYKNADSRQVSVLSVHCRRRLKLQWLQFVQGPGLARGSDSLASVVGATLLDNFRGAVASEVACGHPDAPALIFDQHVLAAYTLQRPITGPNDDKVRALLRVQWLRFLKGSKWINADRDYRSKAQAAETFQRRADIAGGPLWSELEAGVGAFAPIPAPLTPCAEEQMVRQYAIACSQKAWKQHPCFYCRRFLFPGAMACEMPTGGKVDEAVGAWGSAAGVVDRNTRPLRTTTVSKLRAMCEGQSAIQGGKWASIPALDGVTLWELLKVPPFASHEYRSVVSVAVNDVCGGGDGVGEESDCAGSGIGEPGSGRLGLWAILDDVGSTCHPLREYRVQRIEDLKRCVPGDRGCTCDGPETGPPVGAITQLSACCSFQLVGDEIVVARGRITHLTPLELGERLVAEVVGSGESFAEEMFVDFDLLVARLFRLLRGVAGVGFGSCEAAEERGIGVFVETARRRYTALSVDGYSVAAVKAAMLYAADTALVELDQSFSRSSFESFCGVQGTPLAVVQDADGKRVRWGSPMHALYDQPFYFCDECDKTLHQPPRRLPCHALANNNNFGWHYLESDCWGVWGVEHVRFREDYLLPALSMVDEMLLGVTRPPYMSIIKLQCKKGRGSHRHVSGNVVSYYQRSVADQVDRPRLCLEDVKDLLIVMFVGSSTEQADVLRQVRQMRLKGTKLAHTSRSRLRRWVEHFDRWGVRLFTDGFFGPASPPALPPATAATARRAEVERWLAGMPATDSPPPGVFEGGVVMDDLSVQEMVRHDTADQVTTRTEGVDGVGCCVPESSGGGGAGAGCQPSGSTFTGAPSSSGFEVGDKVLVVDKNGSLGGEDVYPGVVIPLGSSSLSPGSSHWSESVGGLVYDVQFLGGYCRRVASTLLRPPPDGVVTIEATGAATGADPAVSDGAVIDELLGRCRQTHHGQGGEQRRDPREARQDGASIEICDSGQDILVKPRSGLFVSDFSNPDADHGMFVGCYPFARGGPGAYPMRPVDPEAVDPLAPGYNISGVGGAGVSSDPGIEEASRTRDEYNRALLAYEITKGRLRRPTAFGFNRHTFWCLHLAGFHFARHPRFLTHQTLRFVLTLICCSPCVGRCVVVWVVGRSWLFAWLGLLPTRFGVSALGLYLSRSLLLVRLVAIPVLSVVFLGGKKTKSWRLQPGCETRPN